MNEKCNLQISGRYIQILIFSYEQILQLIKIMNKVHGRVTIHHQKNDLKKVA